MQDRLNLLLFVSGATATTLTLGLLPAERGAAAAAAAVLFNFFYEILSSRGVVQHAMCPVIDSANHASRAKTTVDYAYFADGYQVVAPFAVQAGEQAYISYGSQTSDSLLQFYGFVEKNNADDLCAPAQCTATSPLGWSRTRFGLREHCNTI